MVETARFNFVLPPGRLIAGHVVEQNKTDYQNRPLTEDKWYRYIGVAVRKDQLGGSVNGQPVENVTALLTAMYQFGCMSVQQYPAVYARAQQFLAGDFSWKIKDGDLPNKEGKKSENAAGCFVFHMQTTLPIAACDSKNVTMDPAGIKRGYYVDVAGSMAWNNLSDNNAGVYMNPQIVRLLAFGPEIIGGPDAATAFAGVNVSNLPPGASAVPIGAGPSAGAPGAGLPGLPGVGGAAPAGLPGVGVPAAPMGGATGLPGAMGGLPPGTASPISGFHQGPGAGGLPPGIG